jgi:hypothetical protein
LLQLSFHYLHGLPVSLPSVVVLMDVSLSAPAMLCLFSSFWPVIFVISIVSKTEHI